MRFIVDGQLPIALKHWLASKGFFDAIHTRDLPNKNLTDDLVIIAKSVREKRIVITKDSDFFKYYILHGKPYKFLMVSTGNIVNETLIAIFEINWDVIVTLLDKNSVVEVDNELTTAHF